ncbi:MAG: VanZ family protein [Candidatus Omnitrophota bacterium]
MIFASKNAWAWLWVFCYAVFIFLCSAVPAQYVPQAFSAFDKVFHIFLYMPFGFLVSRALVGTARLQGFNALLVFIFMIIIYALTDEVHQLYVPGRQFGSLDLLADTVGAMIGRAFHTLWQK